VLMGECTVHLDGVIRTAFTIVRPAKECGVDMEKSFRTRPVVSPLAYGSNSIESDCLAPGVRACGLPNGNAHLWRHHPNTSVLD